MNVEMANDLTMKKEARGRSCLSLGTISKLNKHIKKIKVKGKNGSGDAWMNWRWRSKGRNSSSSLGHGSVKAQNQINVKIKGKKRKLRWRMNWRWRRKGKGQVESLTVGPQRPKIKINIKLKARMKVEMANELSVKRRTQRSKHKEPGRAWNQRALKYKIYKWGNTKKDFEPLRSAKRPRREESERNPKGPEESWVDLGLNWFVAGMSKPLNPLSLSWIQPSSNLDPPEP